MRTTATTRTRSLKHLAACAVLGLFTTLAIAIWFGLTLAPSPSGYLSYGHVVYIWQRDSSAGQGEGSISVDIDRARGATIIHSRAYGPLEFPQWPREEERSPREVLHPWERRVATPWLVGDMPWPKDEEQQRRTALGTGWPFRALSCELGVHNAPDYTTHTWSAEHGIVLGDGTFPGWADSPPTFPFVIPCRPEWEGLSGDTALFGAAWWAVLFAPLEARRLLRRKAGACARCGYILFGLAPGAACPECGDEIPARSLTDSGMKSARCADSA